MWKINNRVKVSPDHYGSGLQGRLGTVTRLTSNGLVEVTLDSMYLAGIGVVAFKPKDLVETKKPAPRKR